MYKFDKSKATELEEKTFKSLHISEDDIEEMLRNSIDILCGNEESMLIVGQQVMNLKRGRSDLTAIDNEGNLVLIELKRDKKDIENRAEAFEFQAIRYAASYATLTSIDELVNRVYAHYIEKYRTELGEDGLTSHELGMRKIKNFLNEHGTLGSFNGKQRIILVASEFDEQTLSAVAWLCSNGVDISCFTLTPYELNGGIYINPQRILPVETYDSYYIELMHRDAPTKMTKGATRQTLPQIMDMLEWGVVKPGDIIIPKDRTDEAILCADGKVEVQGERQSLQSWLKKIYGWSSVQTYRFAIQKETGKSLSVIRENYMIDLSKNMPEGDTEA